MDHSLILGTGENTPFTVQSRKKERDISHDSLHRRIPHPTPETSEIQGLAFIINLF